MSTERSEAQLQLVDALGAVAFAVMGALTKFASEHDLSLTQLRMIGILRDRRLTITQLAYALGLDRSSVSGLVDRMEKRGVVQRQPNPDDARSVHVTVNSHAGADLMTGAEEMARLLSPMTDALNQAETRRLTDLLERMLEHRWLRVASEARP